MEAVAAEVILGEAHDGWLTARATRCGERFLFHQRQTGRAIRFLLFIQTRHTCGHVHEGSRNMGSVTAYVTNTIEDGTKG